MDASIWEEKYPTINLSSLSIYLSIHQSILILIHISMYPSVYPSISSFKPSHHPSIYPSIYLSIDLSIYPPIYISLYPTTYLYISISHHLSIYLSIYLKPRSLYLSHLSIVLDLSIIVVICLGTHKALQYSAENHRTQLVNTWISKASATQRAGRTGRVRPVRVHDVMMMMLVMIDIDGSDTYGKAFDDDDHDRMKDDSDDLLSCICSSLHLHLVILSYLLGESIPFVQQTAFR